MHPQYHRFSKSEQRYLIKSLLLLLLFLFCCCCRLFGLLSLLSLLSLLLVLMLVVVSVWIRFLRMTARSMATNHCIQQQKRPTRNLIGKTSYPNWPCLHQPLYPLRPRCGTSGEEKRQQLTLRVEIAICCWCCWCSCRCCCCCRCYCCCCCCCINGGGSELPFPPSALFLPSERALPHCHQQSELH